MKSPAANGEAFFVPISFGPVYFGMGLERQPEVDHSQIHTYADMVRYLPEDSRYELIAGKLRDMSPAPNLQHSEIAQLLYEKIRSYLERSQVKIAPVDLKLDEENIVQPDLMVILSGTKTTGQYIDVIPDLVIEIASPGSPVYDYTHKYFLYERFGVREYWIVNPMENTVDVFRLGKTGFELILSATKEGIARSEVVAGFEVDLNEIFQS